MNETRTWRTLEDVAAQIRDDVEYRVKWYAGGRAEYGMAVLHRGEWFRRNRPCGPPSHIYCGEWVRPQDDSAHFYDNIK